MVAVAREKTAFVTVQVVTEPEEPVAARKNETRTSPDLHMDQVVGLATSGVYMMSVLVAVVEVVGESSVPWVAGVEEAGIRGSTTHVAVSAGEILDSCFLVNP